MNIKPELVKEIRHCVEKYGIKEVHLVDDVFTFYKERVFKIRDLMMESKLDVDFVLFNGVTIDINGMIVSIVIVKLIVENVFKYWFESFEAIKQFHKYLSLNEKLKPNIVEFVNPLIFVVFV